MTGQQSRPERIRAAQVSLAADTSIAPPLTVDGPRPAVEWVASLPAPWTTSRERVVLFVLACDAFEAIATPGGAALATWCGLINGRLYETLGALTRPTSARPALLERVDRNGQPIPAGKRYGGRARTGYRLRTEVDPASPLSRPSGTVGNSPATPGQFTRPTLPRNSPEKLSRETLPAGRETPFPSLPYPSSPGQLGTDRAREVHHDDEGEQLESLAAIVAKVVPSW